MSAIGTELGVQVIVSMKMFSVSCTGFREPSMLIHPEEILETIKMVTNENLDIRTFTMGINLRGCCHPDITPSMKYYSRILRCAENW
jgi:hypothetical protein